MLETKKRCQEREWRAAYLLAVKDKRAFIYCDIVPTFTGVSGWYETMSSSQTRLG